MKNLINSAIHNQINAIGVILTQADKDYAKKTYDETGQASLKKTLEQFTEGQANQWDSARKANYIPSNVTFIDYLKKIYPEEKRTVYKANVIKTAPEREKLAEKAQVVIDALKEKQVIQQQGGQGTPAIETDWYKKPLNIGIMVGGAVVVGICAWYFGFKK